MRRCSRRSRRSSSASRRSPNTFRGVRRCCRKLMATVNDPQAAMVEISRIIAQDPALTGQPAAHREQRDVSREQSAHREHRPRGDVGGSAGHSFHHRHGTVAAGHVRGLGRLQQISGAGLGAHLVRSFGRRDCMRFTSRTPSPSSRSSSGCCMGSRPSSCFASCATSSRRSRT